MCTDLLTGVFIAESLYAFLAFDFDQHVDDVRLSLQP